MWKSHSSRVFCLICSPVIITVFVWESFLLSFSASVQSNCYAEKEMKNPLLKSNRNRPQYIHFQVSALLRMERHSIVFKDVTDVSEFMRIFHWKTGSLQMMHFILLLYFCVLLANCLHNEQHKQQINIYTHTHIQILYVSNYRCMCMYTYMNICIIPYLNFMLLR